MPQPSTMSTRVMGLASFLGLGAFSLFFYLHRVVLARRDPSDPFVMSDHIAYFLPTTAFLRRSLREGEIPLWNPYQFAGQPIAALHPGGMLYPMNWLFAASFDAWIAQQLHVVVHMALGGFFTWLFARRFGLAPLAAGVAAIIYTLCSYTIYSISFPAYLSTQTWLPAILWAMYALLQTQRLGWVIALAVFVALAFVGGHAQGFLYTSHFGLACALFWLWSITEPGDRYRGVVLLGLAALLSLGLAAPQLLTMIEFSELAARSGHGLTVDQASFGSFPVSALADGLLGPMGFTYAERHWPVSLIAVWPLLALPLVLCGVLSRRFRSQWCFLGISLVIVGLFVAGGNAPVFRVFYELPLGSLFRAPLRAGFLYMWLVGVLAAIGTQAIADWLVARSRVRLAYLCGAVILGVVAVDLYLRSAIPPEHPVLSPRPTPPAGELVRLARGSSGVERTFVEAVRVMEWPFGPKSGTHYGFQSLPDYEPAMLDDYARFFSIARPEVWHGMMTVASWPHEAEQLVRLLDLASVSNFLVPVSTPALKRVLRIRFAGLPRRRIGDLVLVSRKDPLPRAYSVSCVRTSASLEGALAMIRKDGFAPRLEAIVEAEPGSERDFDRLSCSDTSRRALEPAVMLAYSNHEVKVEASCPFECLLVLTDLDYPGWNAWVDGAPARIFRANGLFRGVRMEPGEHQVVFRFQPRSWRIGLVFFGISLVVVVALACREAWRAGE